MTGSYPNAPAVSLEQLLEDARSRIQVTIEELEEARRRRDAIAAAARGEFQSSRVYVNGSVAHGDALTPLTDVDVGVVVLGADAEGYGPGKRGPRDLKERAADAIRRDLKDEYGDLAVELDGRKRSLLVRFRDPVTAGQPDFTADVIVAIDNPAGAGLFIPRYESWDRSHPEEHTRLVLQAIDETDVAYARVVRLGKHWNHRHDKKLCSWNIKALALDCLTSPSGLVSGLMTLFQYAADQLSIQETPDPAGVAPHPIRLNKPRTEVVRALRDAAERLQRAIDREAAGYPALAHDELAKLFNDEEMLPRPDQNRVRVEEARRIAAETAKDTKKFGAPALLTGVGEGSTQQRVDVRSWAP